MSLITSLLSDIDGGKAASPATTANSKPTQAPGTSKPVPRPVGSANGTSQSLPLKRKAEGPPDGVPPKIARKDGSAPPARPTVSTSIRPNPSSDATKPKSAPPTPSISYRGTAGGPGAVKPNPAIKRSTPPANGTATAPKPVASAPRTAANSAAVLSKPPIASSKLTANTAGAASKPSAGVSKSPGLPAAATTSTAPVKKGSYAAMLAAAKAREQIKPAGPPIKHEPTKVLTKKERLELRAQAAGKKTAVSTTTVQAKVGALKGAKADVKEKDKRKPSEPSYQGTARPAKTPVQLAYRGTARPASTLSGPAPKPGLSAQAKAKQRRVNADGYLDWSDVGEDDDDIEEEDGYESSDMEAGGLWDIEEEEARALRAAKEEDAKALAEEMEHKRLKEERKKKLAAMNKAAAAKRKF